jgi:uncharacterized protein
MNEFPFQKFIELIAFDQSSNVLEQDIKAADLLIKDKAKAIETYQASLQKYKQKQHEAKKSVDEKELDMATLNQQLKAKKERLETAADHKAYKALVQEIEHIQAKQHAFEEELIEAWNTLESSTKELEQHTQEIERSIAELTTAIQQEQERIDQLNHKLEQHQGLRIAKCEGVPEEWLEKYEMMRRQVSDPVVEVLNGSCSACFYAIPQQDLVRLRRKQLVQCKGCYRFLYLKEMHEPVETI